MNIGIFDSGFGGLTIMKNIVHALPQYDYIYLGDTARTPYGTRTQDVIFAFTKQAIETLFAQNCSLVIIACNTASAEALPRLQKYYKSHPRYNTRTILGVIIPTAEEIVRQQTERTIGILATESTVLSQAFVKEIHKLDPTRRVIQAPAPLLVPLVEHGEIHSHITESVLEKYLAPLKKHSLSHLILGCTHYGVLKEDIQHIIGDHVLIIEEGPIVAQKLATYLAAHPARARTLSQKGTQTFYTTDQTQKFQKLGSLFYGKNILPKKISLVEHHDEPIQ